MRCFMRSVLISCKTKQVVFGIVVILFSSLTPFPEVKCASLPKRLQPVILNDDGTFSLLPFNTIDDIFYPSTSNQDNHNKINRVRGPLMMKKKYWPTMNKRQENRNNFEAESQLPSRLVKIIQDTDFFRRLLDSGMLNADYEDQAGDYDKAPNNRASHRETNTLMQKPIPHKQVMQEKRHGGGSGCLFHGGLAHNCDYKDLVGAVDETYYWGSDLSPGKKKRKKREIPHSDNGVEI